MYLDSIFDSLVSDQTLPNIKFFEPRMKFGDWMYEHHRGAKVYDVGAGVGHVSAFLHRLQFDMTAIDLQHRDKSEFNVVLANGTTYPYEQGSVVLLCRPCHGWFPENVVCRAVEQGVRAIIYVGLPRNVRNDLGMFRKHFRRVAVNVGRDHENVYEWSL